MILSTLTALWLIATGPAHVPVMDCLLYTSPSPRD